MRQKVTPVVESIKYRVPAREVRDRSGRVFDIEQIRVDDIEPEGYR
jgi:hypothetical protein